MDKQREEFEEWARKYSSIIQTPYRYSRGGYESHIVDQMWQAWQAKPVPPEWIRLAEQAAALRSCSCWISAEHFKRGTHGESCVIGYAQRLLGADSE